MGNIFSKAVIKAINKPLNQDLLASEIGEAYKKEVSKVIQQANRRIQNIEKNGVVSPAVVALNKGDVKGYTKFSMRHGWNDLKIEYSKAIAFLQQPTSTSTGTKEYAKHLKKTYKLSDDEFSLMQEMCPVFACGTLPSTKTIKTHALNVVTKCIRLLGKGICWLRNAAI